MNLTFNKNSGPLSEALGVSQELMGDLDSFVNNLVLSGFGIHDIIKAVQEAFELNEHESAVFMYSLGYFIAKSSM